jgi:flagellar operon protein
MNMDGIQTIQGGNAARQNAAAAQRATGPEFADVLRTKLDGLKFSSHAQTRLKSRGIELSADTMGKLEKAVSGAAAKGCRESLVLLSNQAFIVNIPKRTVITAMDGESLRENIFTNIDSTVIAG